MSSQMNEFEDLKSNLSSVLDNRNEKEARLHDLLTNKMLHLQKMVDYLFLYKNNSDEFKKKVGSAVIQAEKDTYFGELREVVNEKFAGIVDYLEAQFPSLTEDEVNLCCLVCFGFNNNQIGILFGYTNPNSIFNKRHKLRKKMGLWPNYESLEAYLSQTVENLRNRQVSKEGGKI
jgi:chaperonin cofactor prefoldin